MDATAAAAKMLTDPNHFFKYYPVMMAGGTGAWVHNATNLKVFYLAKKSPDMPGQIGNKATKVGHFGATRPGFLHTKNISSFKMEMTRQTNDSGPLNTHGIPMVNYNSTVYGCHNLLGNIAAMPYFVAGAGADYLTTGLLTGCCFAWIVNGANLWCIHVQPKAGVTPQQLHNDMAANGHFAAAPGTALSTFGKNDYPTPYAVVIGVRSGGTWKLYAQTSTDTFKTVNSAWRIHPGPITAL